VGAATDDFLGNDELRRGRRRDLRQMSDANHLVFGGERSHLGAHRMSDFPSHVGIDFIENEQWDRVMRGQG